LSYRSIACAVLACASLAACSQTAALTNEPQRTNSAAATSVRANPPQRFAGFLAAVREADAAVVATLVSVDDAAEAPDKFLTATRWRVGRLVAGSGVRPGDTVAVRLPTGRRGDGSGEWAAGTPTGAPGAGPAMSVGDEYLLLLSRRTYEAQVKARGGRPLDGVTGAGPGLRKVTGRNRIEAAEPFEAPATVDELASMIGD
jgi:hypothetical protein